jgi:hypothetical protein
LGTGAKSGNFPVIDASALKRIGLFAVAAVSTAAALSVLFSVPYIFTAVAFAGWLFFGHLVTIDDDFPGGWSNPDGVHPVPWMALAIKGLLFLVLIVAAMSPHARQWGV